MDKSKLSTHIQMYTALNWPSYNEATKKLLYNDPSANITIATVAMAEGIDAPDIQDVIIVGEVADPDEAHQRWGRAGRDWVKVKDARGIMYLTGSAWKKAEAILKGAQTREEDGSDCQKSKSSRKGPEMSLGMAQMICTPCLSAEQDCYYGNPSENPACFCETCSSSLLPSRRSTCNCSHCIPKMLPPTPKPPTNVPSGLAGKLIHANLKEEARSRLLALRAAIWRDASERDHGSIPMVAFLPDSVITSIINNFTALTSPDILDMLITSKRYLQPHAARLYLVICELRSLADAPARGELPPTSDANISVADDMMQIDPTEVTHVTHTSDETEIMGQRDVETARTPSQADTMTSTSTKLGQTSGGGN
ncbi:hypothetical protein EWM64_g8964 [Hericium alpestre]|uniref:Helicase C-terminal domain-containing protein n=1 Tax=Hericium alpestre TaxID=135208 RepID=A0A4Y9ZNP3_9AGAM|nr:hypothetical protein EWM64_g8964 [Hericium alpestre]